MKRRSLSTTNTTGLTLIELLVVIAIIGILATLTLSWVSGARARGRYTSAIQTMRGVYPVLFSCLNDNVNFEPSSGVPSPGGSICGAKDGGATWPALPSGWGYSSWSSFIGATFTIRAQGDGMEITCGVTGCGKTTP
ncbi:MAG TPA: type II secretion system protein [Candidatus Paceibacterota bacterium]